jgi:O-antigen/teichoic acid export membrane protein
VVGVATFLAVRRLVPQAGWPSVRHTGPAGGWFRYSSIMQVINLLNLTQQQIDKVLLTTWVSIGAVTEFELGFRVANAVQSLPVLALGPLIPAFSEIDAQGDRERLRAVCRRGTALIVPAAFGLAACAIPAAPLTVRAWVGAGYPASEALAQWLLAAFAVNLITGIGTAALRGAGRPGLEVAPGLLALAVHVGMSALLIGRFGTAGVGPALLSAMLVWCVVFLARFARWLEEPVRRLLVPPLLRSGAALAPALAAGFWIVGRWPGAWTAGRMGLLGAAVASGLGAGVVFLGIWWGLGWVRRWGAGPAPPA